MIFGNGEHARVIRSIIEGRYREIGFVVPEVAADEEAHVITERAFFENADRYRSDDVFIGIGDSRIRRRISDRLCEQDLPPATCVASHAFVACDAHLERGVVVCPGAVVMSGARIGQDVILNTLCSVDHDSTIGRDGHLAPGVTVASNVTVGESCFFGIKSATVPGVKIGDNSVIMAGTLVTKDAPSDVVLGGTPAVIVKKTTT